MTWEKHEILATGIEIYLGDCLEVMATFEDGAFDAVITDIPYGTTACSWDEVIPLEPMWKQVKRIDKGVFVTTASQPFTSKLVMSNLDWFKYEWVWVKNIGSNFATVRYMPMKEHESVLVFYENPITYNPQMIPRAASSLKRDPVNKPRRARSHIRKESVYGSLDRTLVEVTKGGTGYDFRNPRSVVYYKSRDGKLNTFHPTQKPVALYEYLIRTYTNEGDVVLDICLGSGTTGVAAIKQKRSFVGIEIDPNYYEIAKRRIKEALMQPRLL